MSTNFPSSLDSYTNPVGTNTLAAPDHAAQHSNENDAIVALETKVGVNSSAVTSTLDYKLTNTSSVDPGHKHTSGGFNGTLPIANGGTGQATKTPAYDALSPNTTKGDLEVFNGTNNVRLPVGTNNYVLTPDSTQSTGLKYADPNTIITPFPTASVIMYTGSSAPANWLLCDGSAVSRTTYSALFAIVSTTYGTGDGSTTFNVPDMRGRVPLGVGTGTGGGASGNGLPTGGSALTARARGDWLGEETHALTSGENGPHTHSTTISVQTSGATASTVGTGNTSSNGSVAITSSSSGSGTAHNNIQPVMGIQFIIKT